MSQRKPIYLVLNSLVLAVLACSGLGAGATPDITATFGAALTQAIATAQAATLPGPGVATSIAEVTQPPQPLVSDTPITLPQATVIKPSDTPAPTNTPGAQGCSDGAQYVADVTIPDNTVLLPGQAFTKTWRLLNSGTCTWVGSYQFAFVADNQMGGPASVAISGNVAAGSQYDVSVNLVAPTTPGTYKSSWRMKNSAGQFFGSTPFVQIVVAAPTSTNTLAPTGTFTLPPPVAVTPTLSATPLGATAAAYLGNWYNNDPATGGITQLGVSAGALANQVNVHAWGRCHPTDCDWGTGTGTVAGNLITINNFPSAPGNTVVLTIPAAGSLQSVSSSGGSGPFTYTFHIGPIPSDWVGTWNNANAGTSNITQIIITVAGDQVSLHPFGQCSPTDCDWGTKTFTYNNPLNTGSAWTHNLVITFVRPNEMTVQDTTVTITENFRR